MKRNTTNTINISAIITLVLSALVIVAAMTLSFSALKDLFDSMGLFPKGTWLAWLFPLLFDMAEVAAAMAVLNAKLQGDEDRYAWQLVLLFTGLGVIANMSHAGMVWYDGSITWLQASVAICFTSLFPLSVAMVTHLAKHTIERHIERTNSIISNQELQSELDKLQAEHSKSQNELDNHLRQVKENRVREIEQEVAAYKEQLYQQVADKQAQYDTLIDQIEKANEQYSDTIEHIKTQNELLNELKNEVSICQIDTKNDTLPARSASSMQRAERVRLTQKLLEQGYTQQQIADKLDVKVGTIKRYVKEIKDQQEKEKKVSIPLNSEQYNDTFDTSDTHLMTSVNGTEVH